MRRGKRSAPSRGVHIGLISTEDCACVEKGASAIAPREQRRPPRRKRKRNLSFPVVSRSSRRRGTGCRSRRPGKTSGILLAEAGRAPVYDTVIPTPALARTSGSPSCPARARSRGELDSARHRVRNRHHHRGTGKNRRERSGRGAGEVYRDDKNAISGPALYKRLCARVRAYLFLSSSPLLLSRPDLVVVRADKRRIQRFL